MHIYSGTDIIQVDRIKNAIQNNKEFKKKIYTEYEIEKIDKIVSDIKYQSYAGRFAAKEAIYKAMSKILIEKNITIRFSDIEIRNIDELLNRPKVIFLNSEIADLCNEYLIDVDVSISHIETNAIAMAIVKIDKE